MKILEDKGYIYQKHLATGGEGEVHLIKRVDKEFIAKIFPALSDASIDVLKTIQKLNIEGVPNIHDIFNYQENTIIIRDYVEGATLYDEIRKNEYLSLKRAKTIILNISETLRQLHNSKPNPIIYRDLKPENIIVTPEGNIQLIDFGIARYYKMESTRDTVLAGTKGYTAPEVMAGMQSDTRSDIYSAGLLFYEMLTGKNLLVPPFQIRPVKESNEYLPEWLDDIVEKATDLNQTKRYRIIDEFIDAIENPVIKKKQLSLNSKLIKSIAIGFMAIIIIGGVFLILSKQNVLKGDNPIPTEEVVSAIPVADEQELKVTDFNEHIVINNVLQNPVMIFEETKEQLISNNSKNIGTTADIRETTEQGVVFSANEGQIPYMPFLKRLDSLGNTNGGNQAFYIKFKPKTKNFIVELTEEWACGIDTGKQGEPVLIVGAYDYTEPLFSSLRIEPDNWYHALIAMGSDGLVHGAIWEDGEEDSAAYTNLHIDRSFGGDAYSGRSWQANIGYEEQIIIEKYAYYTFDNFQTADRVIEVMQNQESYDVLLDLQFDDTVDFEWLFLHEDQLNFADSVQNGMLNMNQEINMKYKFSANSFYHIRLRPDDVDENGTLLLLCFAPQLSSEWSESSYEIKFDNKQPFAGEIRSDYGYYFKEAKGAPMLVDNYWIDVIVWLDEEGKTFRYFIADVENSAKMVYGGATVFDNWVGHEYQISVDLYFEHWQDALGQKMPTSEVEFIRQGTGSIQKYLEENVEAYQKNKSKIDEFINTEIEFIGEDEFTQHGY